MEKEQREGTSVKGGKGTERQPVGKGVDRNDLESQ